MIDFLENLLTILLLTAFAGGVFFGLGISSWGGIQFFIIPLSLFFLALPFFRKDRKFLMWALPFFVFSLLATSSIFDMESFTVAIINEESIPFSDSNLSIGEKILPSIGYGSAVLLGTVGIALAILMIQKINQKHELRNGLAVLAVTTIIGIAVLSSGFVDVPAYCYSPYRM